ncbi:replication-relaxation family protein, partial [Enterococcus gallinarum]
MNDKTNKRITKAELRRLSSSILDSREIEILQTINKLKFVTTKQLQRLFFTDSPNPTTNLRACNRKLKRLKNFGLVANLEQRIGGKRAGSSSVVNSISSAGYQLLRLDDMTLYATRKRLYEPNILFLEHTLAIAETYTRLHEMNRNNKIHDFQATFEPSCWRTYNNKKGVPTFLKPDLFACFAVD